GVNPTSRMSKKATTNMATSTPTRTRKGTPRLVACAITPPATEPTSMATPDTICPRPSTVSRPPSYPVKRNASTSHASTAPEKKGVDNPDERGRKGIAEGQREIATLDLSGGGVHDGDVPAMTRGNHEPILVPFDCPRQSPTRHGWCSRNAFGAQRDESGEAGS